MALTTILPTTVLNENLAHQQTTNFSGFSQGVVDVHFPLQMGVPLSPIYVFKLIPVPGDDFDSYISQPNVSFGTSAAGGTVPLATTIQGTAPNIACIPYNFNGVDGVLLDCERCIYIGSGAYFTQEFTITMTGFDFRGVAIEWTSDTIPTGINGFILTVPISFVTSIVLSANPILGSESSFSFTASNIFGLPYFLPNTSYVLGASWNGVPLSSSANSAIDFGYNWRSQAPVSTYLSARGRVNVGDTAPTGSNMLVVTYYVYGADSELDNEIVNKNQSSLKIVGVQKNASSDYPTISTPLDEPVFVYPYLIPQDLTGVQTNPNVNLADSLGGDSAFLIRYDELVAG